MDPRILNEDDVNRSSCTAAEYYTGPPLAAKYYWRNKDSCMENRASFLAGLTVEMAASTEEWE